MTLLFYISAIGHAGLVTRCGYNKVCISTAPFLGWSGRVEHQYRGAVSNSIHCLTSEHCKVDSTERLSYVCRRALLPPWPAREPRP